MKFIFVLACLLVSTADCGASEEEYSMSLLTETCPKQLNEAVLFVMNEVLPKHSKADYVAVLPAKIGFPYFSVEFMKVKNSIAFPNEAIEFEFEYELSGDEGQPTLCERVEPLDYIY